MSVGAAWHGFPDDSKNFGLFFKRRHFIFIKFTNFERNIPLSDQEIPGTVPGASNEVHKQVLISLRTLANKLDILPVDKCQCTAILGTKDSVYHEVPGWFFNGSTRTITGTYVCKKNSPDAQAQFLRAVHVESYWHTQNRDSGREGDMQTPVGESFWNDFLHRSIFTRDYYAAIDPVHPNWPSPDMKKWSDDNKCK